MFKEGRVEWGHCPGSHGVRAFGDAEKRKKKNRCPGGIKLGIKIRNEKPPFSRCWAEITSAQGDSAHTGREEQEEPEARGHSKGWSRRMHITGRP